VSLPPTEAASQFSLFSPSQIRLPGNAERVFADGNKLIRTLLIAALCATLTGCSCPVPPRGKVETCTSQGCFSRTAASTLIESKRAPFRPEPRTKTVQNVAVAAKPTPAKSVEGRQHPVTTDPTLKKATTTIGGKTEDLSDQSSETSDPVLKKAKITIAGKMENPASAEFVDMRRATRKNTFGQPIDTICGHVKGKKASGEDTGKQPFLYLVKDDEAYVVDANTPNAVAATAYRNICTSPNAQ
jgi:hypothetical protein